MAGIDIENLLSRIDDEIPYQSGASCVSCKKFGGKCPACRRIELFKSCADVVGKLQALVRELEKQNYFLTEELSMVTEDRAVVLGRLRDTKSELKTLSDSIGNLPGRE